MSHDTEITADPALPTIRIVREFDAPPAKVFRAWVEPDLFRQWVGPQGSETTIDAWDCRTGGSWRYLASDSNGEPQGFHGCFHDVRPDERLVQTFTWEGAPDGVSLETMTFEALPDGRTRTVGLSVVESIEIRDMIIASGMERGVVEGFEKLDKLLVG